MTDEEKAEETHLDRRKKYNKLMAGGMTDKQAVEEVWPTTSAGLAKNVKDKEDKAKAGKKAEADKA